MGQHHPSLATKNNKILISACNRGKGEQRCVNEIPPEDARVSNRARVFAGRMHRTCAMRLSRKTKQSYATERNPRNDFPSYAIYIAFHTCRPRHASFVSAVSTCKNPVWNEAEARIRAQRRSIEGEGGWNPLLCDRVDTWPRVGIHHPSIGVAEARWWRGS